MASLKAELSVKLDASSLAGSFLAEIDTPLGSLEAFASPVTPEQIADLSGRTGSLDASSIEAALGSLLEQAVALAGSLPVTSSITAPLTDVLNALQTAVADPELGRLDERLRLLISEAGDLLEGPREGGFLGVLHTLAVTLTGAGEGRILFDLAAQLTGGGLTLPSLPFTDAIAAADGSVRVLGGLMVLDSVTSDVDRLAGVAASRLDVAFLDRQLASLEAALTLDGVELADAVRSVDAADGIAVGRVIDAAASCAALLDGVRVEFAAAMGLGEATLAYLDLDTVLARIDGARTLLRSGDLAPLGRVSAQAASAIRPLLRDDLFDGPAQGLDALVGSVEAQVAELAGRIDTFDVTQLTAPLGDGIAVLLSPLERVSDVLAEIRVLYEGALGRVRNGVAALPIGAIADGIRALLQPIEDVLGAIEDLVGGIMSALDAAATATTTTLGQIEASVDTLKSGVDALFADAKEALDAFGVESVLGTVEESVRSLATLLEQARMDPAFDTAADAIDTAADAIGAVPFGLLPESVKAEVDEAVRPIKEADARAVESEIESLLQITEDGRFAAREELDEAIAVLQSAYEALLAEVEARDPRLALAEVDGKLDELAERVREISPALTLEDVRAAIDDVQAAVTALDVDGPLQPVRDAFNSVTAAIEEYRPSLLIGDVQTRLDDVRAQITEQMRLDEWTETIDDVRTRATDLLDRYDPVRLQAQLEAGLDELQTLLAGTGRVSMMDGLGSVIAGMLGGMGLHVYAASFAEVVDWLNGESGTAVLEARVARAADAIDRTRTAVAALDFAGRTATVAARIEDVRAAIPTLSASLPAGSPATIRLGSLGVRLRASSVFGDLDTNRQRYLATLSVAAAKAEALRRAGFSETDVRVADLRTAVAPFTPIGDWLKNVLAQIGISGFELSLSSVLQRILEVVPPTRMVGLVMPLFNALRGRVEALIDSVLSPVLDAITTLQDLIGALDVGPLLEALDSVHAEVLAQIEALSPDALLGEAIGAVQSLQATLADADPLEPVETILEAVRDTIARVLEKLSLEVLLETPLAIYDQILGALGQLDVARLLAPLLDALDAIARGVDEGLDRTVDAFERLQAALPSGGGGSTLDVGVSVSVGI